MADDLLIGHIRIYHTPGLDTLDYRADLDDGMGRLVASGDGDTPTEAIQDLIASGALE